MSAHALRCFGRNALCVKRKRGEEEDSYEEEEEQEQDGSKKTMTRNNKRMMLREEQLCPRVGEGLCVRMRCSMCDHVPSIGGRNGSTLTYNLENCPAKHMKML